MAEIKVLCPDCGEVIEIEEDKEFCFCGECGRKIVMREAKRVPADASEDRCDREQPAAEEKDTPAAEPAPADKSGEAGNDGKAEAPAGAHSEGENPEAAAPEAVTEEPAAPGTGDKEEESVESKAESAANVPAPEAAAAENAPAQGEQPARKRVLFQPKIPMPKPTASVAKPEAPEGLPEEPAPAPVPAPTGFAAELNRLFKERQYQEAYDGYTQYLQSHPGDIRSLYRQGIAAVYLSVGNIFRTAELRSSVGAAVNAMAKTKDKSLAPEKDEELMEMLVFMTAHCVTFADKLASREECASQANAYVALAGLYTEAVPLITSDARKEEALKAGVEFCDKALAFESSYFSGSVNSQKGQIKEEYTEYSLEKKTKAALKDARARMAENYNSLGSRAREESRLNGEAAAAKKNVSRLKSDLKHTKAKFRPARKLFLAEHPEIKSGRGKILRNTLILCLAVILALAAFAFFSLKNERTFMFILLMVLTAAFLWLACVITEKNLMKFESEQYPPELKELYARLKADKKSLKETKKHSSLAKTALQKFNRSKL